jgi:2Fe-2S ferredoxin
MVAINFVTPEGVRLRIDGAEGASIRDVAINADVPGIVGDCGGFCNCGTCHAYVDEAWLDRLPPASDNETMMLEGAASPVLPNSRLCCQLPVTDAIDGIVVTLPPRQI